MKKLIYLIIPLAIAIYGHSGGAGLVQQQDRTGSPLGSANCALCHSGGTFNATTTIELLDNGTPVSEYTPDNPYTLKVTVAGDGAEGFGFQLIALDDSVHTAGSYGDAPTGTRVLTINGEEYFEHNTTSSSGVFQIPWTAPAANTGQVIFYSTGNAVNANGNTGGDQAVSATLAVTEGGVAGLEDVADLISFKIFPNPVRDYLNFEFKTEYSNIQQISILGIDGRRYQSFSSNEFDQQQYVGDLNAGVYILQIITEQGLASKKWLKI